MPLLIHTNFFRRSACQDAELSINIMGEHLGVLLYANGSTNQWGRSFTYPIMHILNAAKDALKIVMGFGLLLGACFYYPLEAVPQVVEGIGHQISAFVVDVVNTVLSLMSIVTRTLASILSYPFIDPSTRRNLSEYDSALATSMEPLQEISYFN